MNFTDWTQLSSETKWNIENINRIPKPASFPLYTPLYFPKGNMLWFLMDYIGFAEFYNLHLWITHCGFFALVSTQY